MKIRLSKKLMAGACVVAYLGAYANAIANPNWQECVEVRDWCRITAQASVLALLPIIGDWIEEQIYEDCVQNAGCKVQREAEPDETIDGL